MRKTFINTLIQQAREDSNIWLLVADVGYGLVEQFRDEFPDRFINVGIAEQNMIGVASGLALSGKKVFCYSLANFPTLRCLEQIRNDVCYHKLPVTIVSGGAGLYYGALGYSHHATEDVAIMRALPNMAVISPYDLASTEIAMNTICNRAVPYYLRLNSSNDTHVKIPETRSEIKIFTFGVITKEVVKAHDLLKEKGIDVEVVPITIIKPLDTLYKYDKLRRAKYVFSVEEHNLSGGFGSVLSEVITDWRLDTKLIRMGIRDKLGSMVGSQEYLRRLYNLDAQSIANTVMEVLNVRV